MNHSMMEPFDKTQPALIVQHGNTSRKYLPLTRESTVIGRARGCDIELDAPEVAGVHCVVTRLAEAIIIRDCGTRLGTRLNGERITDSVLEDGDDLQVGPFGFRVYLPPESLSTNDGSGAGPEIEEDTEDGIGCADQTRVLPSGWNIWQGFAGAWRRWRSPPDAAPASRPPNQRRERQPTSSPSSRSLIGRRTCYAIWYTSMSRSWPL